MSLSEDEIDDLLYAARVNEAKELHEYLAHLGKGKSNATPFEILSKAIDAESGNSALHYAAANGHYDTLILIESLMTESAHTQDHQSFLNRANSAGNTALHWAALNGHLKAVQLLVKLGANPALTNNVGHDAVFEAERNDKEEIVKWFLAEVPGLEQAVGTDTGEDGMDVEETETSEGASQTAGDAELGVDGHDDVVMNGWLPV